MRFYIPELETAQPCKPPKDFNNRWTWRAENILVTFNPNTLEWSAFLNDDWRDYLGGGTQIEMETAISHYFKFMDDCYQAIENRMAV